jgi:DNA-binding MarR family transcriptional regulator
MNSVMKKQAQSRPVSELRSHLGFWLRFVSNHVSYAFAASMEASGVTVAEWVVLREIYGKPEAAPSALAESTGLTRGAISKLVDRLLKKKLLTRVERSDDRRFQSIALTPAGHALVPELAALADVNDARFFAALSLSEQKGLEGILKKLVRSNELTNIPLD